jgi:hypothetical protein
MNVYFLTAALFASFVLVVFLMLLWSKVVGLEGEIDLLDRRLEEKASKWDLELSDRTKQLHGEKLDALQEHFGILFIEEPKRLVIKKPVGK